MEKIIKVSKILLMLQLSKLNSIVKHKFSRFVSLNFPENYFEKSFSILMGGKFHIFYLKTRYLLKEEVKQKYLIPWMRNSVYYNIANTYRNLFSGGTAITENS